MINNQPKPKGGKRPGSGRPPGSVNKITRAVIEKAEAGGIMPLDYMLQELRTSEDPVVRRWAATSAAPYVHARLASTEVKGEGGGPMVLEIIRFSDVKD
jgi:hypothetical protein